MTWLPRQFPGDVNREWLCFLISFFCSLSSHSWGLNSAAPDAGKCVAGYVEGTRLIAAVRTGGHGVTHCLETRCKSLCGHPAVAQHSQLANKTPFLLVAVSTATVARTGVFWNSFRSGLNSMYNLSPYWIVRKAIFRKATPTFVMSVCPPHRITRLPLDRFSWNFISEYFSKICRENSNFNKICHEYRARYTKIYEHLQYLAEFYLEWNTFQTNAVEKIKTHFMFSKLFPKVVQFMRHWKNTVQPERPQMTT